MLREIPTLQTLCLRAVGPHSCSAEETFAKNKSGEPSSASRLLRSFHQRPIERPPAIDPEKPALEQIPMERTPCIGPGSYRRIHANEVDLNHPIIGCRPRQQDEKSKSKNNGDDDLLIMEYGNPALECLQSYIDSLMELGRMDDARLGVHFFEEWRINVSLAAAGLTTKSAAPPPTKKRRRNTTTPSPPSSTDTAVGSLSLHNCTFSDDTIESMVESRMGPHLAVLDLTGVHGLTDELVGQLMPTCPNLLRMSLKNCRRISVKSLRLVAQYQPKLTCLDVGGSFNVTTGDVLEVVPTLMNLIELHASGLGWDNETIDALVELRQWEKLSLGFSLRLTQAALRTSLMKVANSLISLALPFCESVVDNAVMGILGRNLPHVRYLDVRGNPTLSTLTGWYDGRASADLPVQELVVLGRYSGLSEASVEETKRVHPLEATKLTVILDGGGTGVGITRIAC